jgi:hypothetical protein
MLTQLKAAGLVYDIGRLNPPLRPNPLDFADDASARFPFNFTPRSARAFPQCVAASEPLKARWNQATEMLPSMSATPYKAFGTYADGKPLN